MKAGHFLFAFIITMTLGVPTFAPAKSGYVRPLPPVTESSPILSGCGTHRYHDPETNECRGPGDLWD